MFSIALILLPDFALILFGLVLRRHFEYSAEFWRHLERLVYYVMFPSLLFRAVARTELALFSAVDMLLVGVGFTMAGVVASYMARYFFGADQRALASSIQCGFRFNTYVGLAIIDRLSGANGLATFALLVGVMVPIVNALSVWFLARASGSPLWKELARNPLIIATLSGLAVNLGGIPLPETLHHLLDLFAAAALPLGLLSVGAGLRTEGIRAALGLINYMTAVKLLWVPAVAWGLCEFFALEGVYRQAAMVLATLPTASSAYILAIRMKGDGQLVASIITLNIFVAMLTIPAWLTLAY